MVRSKKLLNKEFHQPGLSEIPDWCLHEGVTIAYDLEELLGKAPTRTYANAHEIVKEERVECVHRALYYVYRTTRKINPRSVVLIEGKWVCKHDAKTQENPCSHILAVLMTLAPNERPTALGSSNDRGRYWAAERNATRNQEQLFARVLCGILRHIPESRQSGPGRPMHPLQSQLYHTIQWLRSGNTMREAASTLRFGFHRKYNPILCDDNTPSRLLSREDLLPLIEELLMLSSAPLLHLESGLAVDGTGFRIDRFGFYLKQAHHTERQHKYIMAQLMVGTRTNVVVAAGTRPWAGEAPYFIPLLMQASRLVTGVKVTGDAAYWSKENANVADVYDFDILLNAKKSRKMPQGGDYFARMTREFRIDEKEFMRRFGPHQNVEATNHALKSRITDRLRTRSMKRRRCEVLLLVLIHNVYRLIHYFFEEGVVPDFNAAAREMARTEKVFTCDKKVPESYLEHLKLTRRRYEGLVWKESPRDWLWFDDSFTSNPLEDFR